MTVKQAHQQGVEAALDRFCKDAGLKEKLMPLILAGGIGGGGTGAMAAAKHMMHPKPPITQTSMSTQTPYTSAVAKRTNTLDNILNQK